MATHTEIASPSEKSERAAPSPCVIGSGEGSRPPCPTCGTPLRGRQRSACSDRCRAAKSRRRRIPFPLEQAREIRHLVRELAETSERAQRLLEDVLQERGGAPRE